MSRFIRRTFISALAFAILSASFVQAQDNELLGAGATFPYPLYSKMFDVYNKQYGVKVNYQSIGSGGGIRQLESKTVDFGASDAFMSDEKLESMQSEVLHIPTCLGAVVVTYNIPGNTVLNITPDVLSDIYLGKIKKWNDPRIAEINSGVKLPNLKIMVVHRSDGSGTTFIFTDYLGKISSDWKDKVGVGKSVKWPTGLGAKGNEGVSGLVKQIKGSIGYCELAYALHNNMPTAHIKNSSGKFIKPQISSISAAANAEIPAHTRVSLTNTDAEEGYPISSFTWILLYKEQNYRNRSKEKANTLVDLLWWMIHDGQKHTQPLDYAPLSDKAVEKAEKLLKSVTYDGTPIKN